MAKKPALEKAPLLKEGTAVELRDNYFRFNQRDPPYTMGKAYTILKIVRHSRPKDGKLVRKGAMLKDDRGDERMIDFSFLAKVGYTEAYLDRYLNHRKPDTMQFPPGVLPDHPEFIPEDDLESWVWIDVTEDGLADVMPDVQEEPAVPEPEEKPKRKHKKRTKKEYSTFSRTLRKYMEELGISVSCLASRLEVSETNVRMLKTKLNSTKISTAQKVGSALGLEGEKLDGFLTEAGFVPDVQEEPAVPEPEEPKKRKEYSVFSRTLRKYMDDMGISVTDLANRLGTSEGNVSRLRTKVDSTRLSTAQKVGSALGLEGERLDEFLMETGYVPGAQKPEKEPKKRKEYSVFSRTLRKYMEDMGISASDLANRLETSEGNVKRLRTKVDSTRLDTAQKVGTALGLEGEGLEEFLTEAGYDTGQSGRKTLGSFLKRCRMLSGKMQKEVAYEACISPGYLSSLERDCAQLPGKAMVLLLGNIYNLGEEDRNELRRLWNERRWLEEV